MRVPHYWTPSGRTGAPSEIVVFDCETHAGPGSEVPGGEHHKLRLGCALAYRLERGRRTRQVYLRFTSPEQIWGLILSRLSSQRPVWVYGHNLAYDLAAARLWGYIESESYLVSRPIIEHGIFLIEGEWEGKGLCFADTFNYYKTSLASLGADHGYAKMTMPAWSAPDEEWYAYCQRDVEVTALALDSLVAFWKDQELGPWQPTIASLAFSAFRRKFLKHKVLVHNYREPLRVERSAYFGGIVDTPYLGRRTPGRVHELDVCSLYPSVCLEPLPTVLREAVLDPSPERLRREMHKGFVIADVTLKTDAETYPCRVGKKVYYARGEYRTSLAHPELTEAFAKGRVTRIHFLCRYDHGRIFADYMRHFTSLKTAYREAGNGGFSTACKYLANSLYGKCGQLTPRWREWGPEAFADIEREHDLPEGRLSRLAANPPQNPPDVRTYSIPDLGITLEMRQIFGILEVKVGHHESRDSVPAVAAAVTSYARRRLRSLQAAAGVRNYYYSDTDSIWVNDAGLEALTAAGEVASGVLGKLEHRGTHDWLIVHGPKDYETPDLKKMKGIRKQAEKVGDASYVQLQFPSAKQMLQSGVRDGVMVLKVPRRLHRVNDHCRKGEGGWTTPLVFPHDLPGAKK